MWLNSCGLFRQRNICILCELIIRAIFFGGYELFDPEEVENRVSEDTYFFFWGGSLGTNIERSVDLRLIN